MSRLIAAATIALFAAPTTAHAAEPQFSFDARVGYASAWTTGQEYAGLGTGLGAGVTLPMRLHLGAGAVIFPGTIAAARNGTTSFWSRSWSTMEHATVGIDLRLAGGSVLLRPALLAGVALVGEATRLGPERRADVSPLFIVGPGLTTLVQGRYLHAGLDAHAYFLPARALAPVGALFGVLGTRWGGP